MERQIYIVDNNAFETYNEVSPDDLFLLVNEVNELTESDISYPLFDNGDVSGTLNNLNFAEFKTHILNLIGNTDITFPSIADDTNVRYTLLVTGDFALAFTNVRPTINSEAYDGSSSQVNRVVVDHYNMAGAETIYVTNEIIA
jgi:hypothetical protein